MKVAGIKLNASPTRKNGARSSRERVLSDDMTRFSFAAGAQVAAVAHRALRPEAGIHNSGRHTRSPCHRSSCVQPAAGSILPPANHPPSGAPPLYLAKMAG